MLSPRLYLTESDCWLVVQNRQCDRPAPLFNYVGDPDFELMVQNR